MSKTFRIEYDDQVFDIIAKVNEALESHGLEFVFDENEHDGFEICALRIIVPE